MQLDWGTVPDWISAIATAIALAGATGAAYAAFKQLRMLEQQEAARQHRDKQADAAGVAIWARVGTKDNLPVIRYINLSGKPIYELTIWIQTPAHTFLLHRTVAGPAQETRPMREGTKELCAAAEEAGYHPDWTHLLKGGELQCASRFRDTANEWWLREFDGRLHGGDGRRGGEELVPSGLRISRSDSSALDSPTL